MSVSQPFVPVSYNKYECTGYAEKLSMYGDKFYKPKPLLEGD